MNKYQFALNNLRKFEREYNMLKFGDVIPQTNSDTLQELVDKETPMKPIANKLPYEVHNGEVITKYYEYNCPKCNCTIHLDWHEERNFCPECGQKLDWSDEYE